MGDGFRGIDPLGLAGLAKELDQHGSAIGNHRRAVVGILQSVDRPGSGDVSAALQSVEAWTEAEADNLRWRADAVATGQRLYPGCGVPELFVAEAHDRALIGAFLPSGFDLEAWAQQWAVNRSRRVGRELADRYRAGESVSEELVAISYRPHYEAVAAAFFNALGPDLVALIPQNVQYSVRQTGAPDAPASIIRLYARAFAAATRSDDLTFTPEELFARQDPTAQMLNQFEAAHLLTEGGVARPWLVYAADTVLLGEAYIPWVTSAQSVASVATGLANNPGMAGEVLAEPGAVEMLLRRSTLLDDHSTSAVGDALVAAAVTALDRATAARVAAATIEAIGGEGVRPSAGVLPGVALVGGTYLDEIAWSLVGWEHDPTYRPRFEVERNAARRFLLETMRDTDAYATILAATGVWISSVTVAEEPTTFAVYTKKVLNRADDIGMLLATIIGADRIIGVESAEEQAHRQAMLLNTIDGVLGMAAHLTGPGAVLIQPTADLLKDRAAALLDIDPIAATTTKNDAFREVVLDELRAALHEIIVDLELSGPDADLDPQTLAEQQGAVLMRILATIYATMSQFEPEYFE